MNWLMRSLIVIVVVPGSLNAQLMPVKKAEDQLNQKSTRPTTDDAVLPHVGINSMEADEKIPEILPEPVIEAGPLKITVPPEWQLVQKPGNYQKKAQIFKRAGEVYDDIRSIEPFLLKAREAFFSSKIKLNQEVVKFFFEIGIDQGELAATLDNLLAEIEKEEKKEGDVLEEDREIEQELKQNKADLNQLKQNIAALQNLSGSLDNALAQLDGVVKTLESYEEQGWEFYQEIDEIFDDRVAQDLLGKMNSILENAQALQIYVQGPFSQFFSTTSSAVSTQMTQITSAMQSLKSRGIALVKQEDEIDKKEHERLEAERAAQAAAEAKKAAEEAAAIKPWYASIQQFFVTTWQWLQNSFQAVYTVIFGRRPEQPMPPVPTSAAAEEPGVSPTGPAQTSLPMPSPIPAPQEPGLPKIAPITLPPAPTIPSLPQPPNAQLI